jgi:hypothetical protein
MKQQMVRISVEVWSGGARFRVGIQAPSIRVALALAGSTYPKREVRVVFPAELQGSLARKPTAPAGEAGHEQAHAMAA